MEILTKQVGSYGIMVAGVGGRFEFAMADREKPVCPLDAIKPVTAAIPKLQTHII